MGFSCIELYWLLVCDYVLSLCLHVSFYSMRFLNHHLCFVGVPVGINLVCTGLRLFSRVILLAFCMIIDFFGEKVKEIGKLKL